MTPAGFAPFGVRRLNATLGDSIRSGVQPPHAKESPAWHFSVVVVQDPVELEQHVGAWESLAAVALEPNVFYEPWMLLPALRAFGAVTRLVLVYAERSDQPAVLGGVFPVERRRHYRGIPVSVLRLWQHPHCYLATPLVRADLAGGCLGAFLDWAGSDPRGAALVEFPDAAADGPFHDALMDCLRERAHPVFVASQSSRALFRTASGSRLPGQRRRALQRKERALGKQGTVDYRALEPGGDVETWVNDFMQCEARGWKGRQGTAMACTEADRTFLRATASAAFQRGRFLALALCLNGRPIGLRCSFLAGDGAFAFKTCYDEAYGRFSPGVLLEVETMRQVAALANVRWMDSCTAGDSPLFNALWKDRRVLQTTVAAPRGTLAGWVVKALPWLREAKRRCFPRQKPTNGER